MRIVMVTAEYSWPNYVGGIKTFTQTLSKSLASLGHEVHIITSDIDGTELHYKEGNIFVHCVGPRRILPRRRTENIAPSIQETRQQSGIHDVLVTLHLLRRSWRVRNEVMRLSKNGGVDIVEVPDWNAEGFWLTIRPFVPQVVTLHGPRYFFNRVSGMPRTLGTWMAEALEKQAILRATAIVSPSFDVRRSISQEYQLPALEERIIVIPNPVDISLFKPGVPEAVLDPSQALTVTYVGRLDFRKGVQVLAAAIPEIMKECPGTRFKFIGSDTSTAPGGGSMQAYIFSQLGNCKEAVEFTGPLPHHALPVYYARSAIVVIPSLEEPFGLTCIEAMACGGCVVASRIGGLAEIIRDGDTGFLVPPGDPELLVKGIVHLLNSPNERHVVGMKARAAVTDNMSNERVTARRLALYRELLA